MKHDDKHTINLRTKLIARDYRHVTRGMGVDKNVSGLLRTRTPIAGRKMRLPKR